MKPARANCLQNNMKMKVNIILYCLANTVYIGNVSCYNDIRPLAISGIEKNPLLGHYYKKKG